MLPHVAAVVVAAHCHAAQLADRYALLWCWYRLPALDKLYSMMPKESFEDRFPYFAGFLHATRLRGTEGRSLGAKAIGAIHNRLACAGRVD